MVFPSNLSNPGLYAFSDCYALTAACFRGDAPNATYYVFGGGPETVFYLPGTTGWDPYFQCTPAAPRLPQIHVGDGSFGVRTNAVGCNLAWAGGRLVVVEAATNPAQAPWIPLVTNTLAADTWFFSDPQWTNYPARFYRVRSR